MERRVSNVVYIQSCDCAEVKWLPFRVTQYLSGFNRKSVIAECLGMQPDISISI